MVGLARSDASAQKLEAAGAIVHRGDLDDPEGLAKAAADADGVIHLAFQHEIAFGGDFAAAGAADRRAVEAMGAALAGSDRPFVLASGMVGLALGRPATEDDGLVASPEVRANPAGVRGRHRPARPVASGPRRPLLGAAVPPDGPRRRRQRVHGHRSSASPASSGVAGYVGDGTNRWPAVHVSDAARLARLAVEAAPAGSVLHAVGEEGVPFLDIAEAMGRGLGIPTRSVDPADAVEHFGFLGLFAGLDSPVRATVTRDLLGWEATGPSLLEDLEKDYYYRDV